MRKYHCSFRPTHLIRLRMNLYMKRFEAWASLSTEERQARESLASNLMIQTRRVKGSIDCTVFGSHATGLATPSSDIDIAVVKGAESTPEMSNKRRMRIYTPTLHAVKQMIHRNPHLKYLDMVKEARHPLVAVRHVPSQTDFQMVFSSASLERAELVTGYLDEYPHLKTIFLIVRTAMEARDLLWPHGGGIGSYPLLTMIVAFFKICPNSGCSNVGATLKEFFDFYAEFNTRIFGITLDPPSTFKKVHGQYHGGPDPQKPRNIDQEVSHCYFMSILRTFLTHLRLNMRSPRSTSLAHIGPICYISRTHWIRTEICALRLTESWTSERSSGSYP